MRVTATSLLKARWPLVLLAVGLLVFPLAVHKPFPVHLATMVFMWSTLGMGWNLLGGYAGQVSLGHAVYFGLGAYVPTLLLVKGGVVPWVGMVAGAVVACLLAFLLGWPLFRLYGHYFSIATICLGELVWILFTNWDWAGGARGLFLPIKGTSLLYMQFSHKAGYYYLSLLILVCCFLVARHVATSRPGYYFRAIKGDPDAALALGINITRFKIVALLLSALFACICGCFYANYVLYIDPDSTLVFSISCLMCLIPVLGGLGTLAGPIIGAAILVPLSELTRVYFSGGGRAVDLFIYGTLIVIFAVFQPTGLVGLVERFRVRVTKR